MRQETGRRAEMFVLIGVGLAAAGCHLIGFGIGAIVDTKPRPEIPGWAIETIEPGEKIELTLANGDLVRGKFTGLSLVPDAEYVIRYDHVRVALRGDTDGAVDLPRLGAGAVIVDASGNKADCEYRGLELSGIAFLLPARADVSTLSFERLHTLADREGRRVDGVTLRRLVHERKLPIRSEMTIDSAERIRIEEIAQLRLAGGNAKQIGFLAGLLIDVMVVVAAVAADDPPPPTRSEHPENSCPFIYSFDGEGYRLEGEIFGGAIFEAAQRTAWDELNHPRWMDGRYRIKVTNELQETQFVDELKLIVVDHAPGVEVLPSATGELHTLSHPRPPRRAVDSMNHDVTRLLARADGDVWLDNPFVRAADSGDGRSAIELVFTRPAFARKATLVVSVRNTLWASYLRRGTLEILGSDLERWYALMNTSAEARGRFRDASIREGMLRVDVWDGESWNDAGHVWEVGPSTMKRRLVTLDVPSEPSSTLRVRLSSAPAHWMVDAVFVEYEAMAISSIEVAAERALDHRGRDVRDLLASSDGRRYVMPTTSDWAVVDFPVPPVRPGLERSLILKSSGYYTIHLAGRGEPQTELVERLIEEPGAYGRYTLGVLRRYFEPALRRALAD